MILFKTEAGQQVLKDRSVRLTPRQRSAFILFDGKRSTREILQACDGVGDADIEALLARGLLTRATSVLSVPAPSPSLRTGTPARDKHQRYKDAYPVAVRLAGSLGLRGFRLNLAIEGATSFEQIAALAPRIRDAVGPGKAADLYAALEL